MMFYSTQIAPEFAFTNGQLARYMENLGEEHWKVMARFIGYMKGNQKYELIIKKPMALNTVSQCNNGYGNCKDRSKSNIGQLKTIEEAVTSCKY